MMRACRTAWRIGARPGGGCRSPHIAAMMAAAKHEICPICGKPAVNRFRPFCSRRCKDVDLNRWLSGVYAVALTADDDEDGTPREHEPER